ncbi:MAG: IPTL-CTERM sorting domain-containing protein, partial [Deltaproteobacteria bacterium]|nr:IPTL-CTERM sorting domain-containing protein [Deltaproteobacteria bacterium]
VDGSGNAYVAGKSSSADFPTQNPYQATYAGNGDAFITQLASAGNTLVYSTYLGGSGGDSAKGIAVDGTGNAYVAGFAGSTDFPTQNACQATGAGKGDAFITQLTSAGNTLVYSTYLGGSGADSAKGIAVDGAGDAYVTGETKSADFPTQNPYQAANAGDYDAFVAKLSQLPIPTLNQWGLIGLMLLLTGIGCIAIRRGKRASV